MLSKIHDALQVINLGFPNYCLGHGLMDLAYNQYLTEYYTQIGIIRLYYVVNNDHFTVQSTLALRTPRYYGHSL